MKIFTSLLAISLLIAPLTGRAQVAGGELVVECGKKQTRAYTRDTTVTISNAMGILGHTDGRTEDQLYAQVAKDCYARLSGALVYGGAFGNRAMRCKQHECTETGGLGCEGTPRIIEAIRLGITPQNTACRERFDSYVVDCKVTCTYYIRLSLTCGECIGDECSDDKQQDAQVTTGGQPSILQSQLLE